MVTTRRQRQAPKLHPQLVRSLNQRPVFFYDKREPTRKINSINATTYCPHWIYIITAIALERIRFYFKLEIVRITCSLDGDHLLTLLFHFCAAVWYIRDVLLGDY